MSFIHAVNGTREIETWITNDDGTPIAIYHLHTTNEINLPEDDEEYGFLGPDIITRVNIRFCTNYKESLARHERVIAEGMELTHVSRNELIRMFAKADERIYDSVYEHLRG